MPRRKEHFSFGVENYIAAAKNHGEADDPDHEVGDLQDLLRAAYKIMKPAQRETLLNSDEAQKVLEDGDACLRCSAVPGTDNYGTVGDGFDGYCPSCADRRERTGEVEIG